jgi:putative membrane protein
MGLGVLNDDDMREPDYRFSLAVERTHLAYVRTALATFAGSVVTLGYLRDVAAVGLATVTGVGLFAIGLITLIGGQWRCHRLVAAIRAEEPLAKDPLVLLLSVLIGIVAITGLLSVLLD